MKHTSLYHYCLGAVLAFGLVVPAGFAQEPAKQANVNDKIQVDARGPIHEAFAQPWQPNPGPNQAVNKKPPDPIPEEPAAEKPKGKNVQWIPGYWQWDLDRKDFVWVSGLWRDMPNDRRWVMGYWTETPDGYRWVSGHFAAKAEKDNQYVPEPPQNPDKGPTTAAPDNDSFYVPGSYVYTDTGYNYRDGYWTGYLDDSVWIPARYNWSPYGWTYASGYWDYPFANRGLLFAPAYFNEPLWQTPGWFYRPSYALGFPGLLSSLFVGLGSGQYYFGDWYARPYLGNGITPWFWFANQWYDPLWTYDRWANRANPNWAAGVQNAYIARVNGTQPLPPRTLSAQTSASASANTPRMVNTLAQVRASGTQLTAVTSQQHATSLQAARQMTSQAQQTSRSATQLRSFPGGGNTGGVFPGGGNTGGVFPGGGRSTGGAFPGGGNTGGVFPGGGHNVTPAPHVPTGPLPNINRPSFPPPHPGGGTQGGGTQGGGHGGGNKPPHK